MPLALPRQLRHLRRSFVPGSAAARRTYIAGVRKAVASINRTTEADMRRMMKELGALDRAIRDIIASRPLTPAGLPSIQSAVRFEMERTEAVLQRMMADGIKRAGVAGEQLLLGPLQSATRGQLLGAGQTIGVSRQMVDVAAQHSADLIGFNRGGLSARALLKVNTEINLGVLGARSGVDAMKNISRALGANGVITKEVRRIYATETLRVYSMSTQATMEDLQPVVGSVLKKAWLWSRLKRVAHAQAEDRYGEHRPIAVEKPFIVAGEPLLYPRDPSGSPGNTINCRCLSIPVVTDFGEMQGA